MTVHVVGAATGRDGRAPVAQAGQVTLLGGPAPVAGGSHRAPGEGEGARKGSSSPTTDGHGAQE